MIDPSPSAQDFSCRLHACKPAQLQWNRHGRHLKLFDKKTAQALMTVLVFALILMFLYVAWRAIIAFLFAIFFAYILEAPVSRLQGWLRGSRPAAIAVVYVVFIGALILAFLLAGP